MSFKGASADVETGNNDIVDSGGFQQPGNILGAIIREAIPDSEDTQSVRILG